MAAPPVEPPQDAGVKPPAPTRKLDRTQMAIEAATRAMPQRQIVPGSQQAPPPPPGDPNAGANWVNVNDPKKLKPFSEHTFKNPNTAQTDYINLFSQQTDDVKLKDNQRFHDTLNIMNEIGAASQILSNITEEGAIQSALWQGATGFFGTTGIADKMDKDFQGALTQVDAEGNITPVTGQDGKPMKNGHALDLAALHVAKLDAMGLGHLVDKNKRDILKKFEDYRNYAGQVRGVGEMYGLGKITSLAGGALIKGAEAAGGPAIIAANRMKNLTTKLAQAATPAEKAVIQTSIDAINLNKVAKPFWTGPATALGKGLERLGGARGGHFSKTVLPMVEMEGVAGAFEGAREYGDNASARAAAAAWNPATETLEQWKERSGNHLLERIGAVAGGAVSGGYRGIWSGIGFWIPSALMGAAGRRIMPKAVSEADLIMQQTGGFKAPLIERIANTISKNPVTGSMIRAPVNIVKHMTTFYTGNNIGHFMAEVMTGHEPTAFKTGDFWGEMIGAGAFGAVFGGAETIAWRNRAKAAAKLGNSPAARRTQIESVERLTNLIYTKDRHKQWITDAIDKGFPPDQMADLLGDIATGGIETQPGLAKVGLAVQKHFALKAQGPQAPKPQASTKDVRFFDRMNEARRANGQKPLKDFDAFDAEMREAALVHGDAANGRDPVAFAAGEKLRELYEHPGPLTPAQHTELLQAEATLRGRATVSADVEVGTAEHRANIRSMLMDQLQAAKSARRVAAATPGQMVAARTASLRERNIAEKIQKLDSGDIPEALQNEYLAYLGQTPAGAPTGAAPQAQQRGWQPGAQPVGRGGGPPGAGPGGGAAGGAAAAPGQPGFQPGAQPGPGPGLTVNPAAPGASPPGATAPGAAAGTVPPAGATAPQPGAVAPGGPAAAGAPSAGVTPAKSAASALGTPTHASSSAALRLVFAQGQSNWNTATRASLEATAARTGKSHEEIIRQAMKDLDLQALYDQGGYPLIEKTLASYVDNFGQPAAAAQPTPAPATPAPAATPPVTPGTTAPTAQPTAGPTTGQPSPQPTPATPTTPLEKAKARMTEIYNERLKRGQSIPQKEMARLIKEYDKLDAFVKKEEAAAAAAAAGGTPPPAGGAAPPPAGKKGGRAKAMPLKNHADAMRFIGANLSPDQLKYVSEATDPQMFRERLNDVALDPKTSPALASKLRTILADKLIGKSMDKPASPWGEEPPAAATPGTTAPTGGPAAPAAGGGGAAPATPGPAAPATGTAAPATAAAAAGAPGARSEAQGEVDTIGTQLTGIADQLRNPKMGAKQRTQLLMQADTLKRAAQEWKDLYPDVELPAEMRAAEAAPAAAPAPAPAAAAPPKTAVERATTAPEPAKSTFGPPPTSEQKASMYGQAEAQVLKETGTGDLSPEARKALRTIATSTVRPMDYEARVRKILAHHGQGTKAEMEASLISHAQTVEAEAAKNKPKIETDRVQASEALKFYENQIKQGQFRTQAERNQAELKRDYYASQVGMWAERTAAHEAAEAARLGPQTTAQRLAALRLKQQKTRLTSDEQMEAISALATLNPEAGREGTPEGMQIALARAASSWHRDAKLRAAEAALKESEPARLRELLTEAKDSERQEQQWDAKLAELMASAPPAKPIPEEPAPAKKEAKPEATADEAEGIALALLGEGKHVNVHDFARETGWEYERSLEFLNKAGVGPPPPEPEGAEAPPGFVAGMRKQAQEAHRTRSPEQATVDRLQKEYDLAAAAYAKDVTNIDLMKASANLHKELAVAKNAVPDIYSPKVEAPVGAIHTGVYKTEPGSFITAIYDEGTNKWHVAEYADPRTYPEGGEIQAATFLDQPTAEAWVKGHGIERVHPESLDKPRLPSKGPPPPAQPRGAEKAEVQEVPLGQEVPSPGQIAMAESIRDKVPTVQQALEEGNLTAAKERWDQMPFTPAKRDAGVLIQAHETGERMLAYLGGVGEKKKDQQPRLKPTPEEVKRIREILEGRYLPHMDVDPRTELAAPVTLKPDEQAYVLSNQGWEEAIQSTLSPHSRAAKNFKDDAVYAAAKKVLITGGGEPWAPREGEQSGQAIVRNNWPPRRRNRQTGVMEQIMNRTYNKRFESATGGKALTYTEETLKEIREGTFKQSDKETAATSMLRMLHSIHEQNGIVTPGDVMRSIFTIHAPTVPEILVNHTLRGSKFGSSAANARLMRKGLLVDLGLGEIAKNKKGQPLFDPKEDLVTPGHLELFYPPDVVQKFATLMGSKDAKVAQPAIEAVTRMWNEAYDREVHAWNMKVLEAATTLPYEARKGALAGTYLEHFPTLINSYLGYARAATSEGYNVFNLIGAKEGTFTPRTAWLNLLYNEPFAKRGTFEDSRKAEKQLQDLFGFESPPDGYKVTLEHLFPDKGEFDKVIRAYEVLNDIGTPGQLMAGEVLNNTLTEIKDPEHKGLMEYEMGKDAAKAIVEALESGKVEQMRDILRLGQTVISEVRLPGSEKVEPVRTVEEDFSFSRDPTDLMSWSIRPNEPAFVKMLEEVETKTPEVIENLPAWRQQLALGTQGVGSLGLPEGKTSGEPKVQKMGDFIGFEAIRHYANSTPKEIEQAIKDLQRLPYDVINSAEMIRDAKLYDLRAEEAKKAGNMEEAQLLRAEAKELYMRSETAMASAIERTIWEGKSELSILEMMADFDTFGMKSELGTEVGKTQRSWTKMLVGEMHARKWMKEIDGTNRLFTSQRMTHLVTRIAHIRGRAFTNKFAERHAMHMREHGENPLMWICHSSCVRNLESIKEWADELPEKLKIVGQRMKKLWSENRDNITNAVASWGRQIVDPHAKEIQTGLINRLTATNRNRVGDVLSNTLSKYNIEKDTAMIDLVAGYQGVLAKHGFKELQPILHERPEWDRLTPTQQQEQLELRSLLRVLDGRPGASQVALSARAKNALPEMRQFLLTMKKNMASHLFSNITEAANLAIAEGTEMPRWVLRRWSRLLGNTTDPRKVLDILKHTIEADPNEAAKMIHGVSTRGWGLKQYYPHIWRSSNKQGDAFTHQRDPGSSPDADTLTDHWVSGEKIESWKKEYVEDYARSHGFIGNHKRMSNMLERLGDKDGYIEDLHYTMQHYVGRMVEKIYWERLTKDLNPMIFGDWQKVDATSKDGLRSWLSNVPWESKDSHHALLGGVDQHFGIRLTGKLMSAGYRLLTKEGVIKPESKNFGKEQRYDASKRWRRDIWRVSNMNLEHWDATDAKLQKKVVLELSNGSERLVLHGKKAIEAAGMEVRKGGLTNYKEGTQFAAITKVIRDATGFDVESMRHTGPGKEGMLGKAIRNVADVTSEFIYQTQLGGYINTKAAGVQMMEGIIQNFSALGWGPMKDFMPHMKGGLKFIHDTLISGDPIAARERLKVERAGTEYVDKVLPVLEAGRMQVNSLINPSGKTKGMLRHASRVSYAGFSTADVFTKEMAYYAAYKKAVEVGQWKDPETGRQLQVTPDYIGVGEQHKRFSDFISAHDIARMVVERTHFTLPKWAQPGIVKLPGWSFFGHLGTQATNITAEFWYGMGSMGKYLKTGDPVHAFQAKKAGQYMAAMGMAMGLASFLGRDIGAYVGQHPKDVGFDDYKLGKIMPFLDVLPNWVRIPAWQPPNEMSLPAKMWFGPKTEEGILPTIGDAMLRRMSGEQTLGQGFESAFGNWWNHNSRTITGRVVRPLSQIMTAEPSDLDPDRPNQVRDPWWMGPEQKTRYRSDFDLYFGDLFLPGWSMKDSSEQQRTLWANQLTGVRSKIGRELRQRLRSTNPEIVEEAYQELQDRGFKVDGWRQRKAAQMDKLPSNIRLALGHGDRVTKLKTFAMLGEDWDPAFRQLALRWILPENKKPNLRDLPPGLWDQVMTALEAP